MKISVLGFIILIGVFFFCLSERNAVETIGFFDSHAAIVVFGGVLGALMIALSKPTLLFMSKSFFQHITGLKTTDRTIAAIKKEWSEIQQACREGKRSVILNFIENSSYPEVRACCEVLLHQIEGSLLQEKFMTIRQENLSQYEPVIEGWDLVARLAPSFGMVGTVTGMVQLFKNMASSSSNLGGAMGMALLATLYGIAFGAAVGGPMSTKMSNELNERLNLIDLFEVSVSALLLDLRKGERR